VSADPAAAFALAALAPGAFLLEAGAFADPAVAEAAAARVREAVAGQLAPDLVSVAPDPRDAARLRVMVGPFRDAGAAAAASRSLRRALGLDPLLRVAEAAP
jgi:hypothetical protein